MRTARKNQQILRYALHNAQTVVYEVDDEGNFVLDEDGNPIPTGDYEDKYSKPVKFSANITFSSGTAQAEAYGIATSDYDSKIVLPKNLLPIDETSLIWYESTPTYGSDGYVDEKSADFRVKKVQPSLGYTVYLLKRIEK